MKRKKQTVSIRTSYRTRVLLSASLVSSFILACQPLPSSSGAHTGDGGRILVAFGVADAASAVTPASSDTEVLTLDLLAFRQEDGALDVHRRESGRTLTASVLRGTALSDHLVANAPEGSLDGIGTQDEYLQAVSLLGDNADGLFVMAGSGSGVFVDNGLVSVDLTRMVSRIRLDKITPLFLEGTFLGQSDVLFRGAFLVNVCSGIPYSMTPSTSGLWYNALQLDTEKDAGISALTDALCSVAVTSSDTFDADIVTYACPNPVDNGVTWDTAPLWSARNTRLVLWFTIGGQDNYYPITLPSMEANKEYHIKEARLLGFGAAHPDASVVRDAIHYTIAVNDWGTVSHDISLDPGTE